LLQQTATLITFIVLFLVAAIVPGYKGFAISMQSKEPGAITDADFWYLVQSSIMAVLGNIVMVIPLLRESWFSSKYGQMWAFTALGLGFSILSIALYPFVNPGWSSMASFFGSIASVASVLVVTQTTAKDVRRRKVKAD
jgi:hypothetical protein